MNPVKLTYYGLNAENRRLLFAVAVSFFFHLLLLYLLQSGNAYVIDAGQNAEEAPREVMIVFPENKPKQIVENMNENREVPDRSDLLSEADSRAKNQNLMELRQDQPSNAGNVPFANLSPSRSSEQDSYAKKSAGATSRKFSRSALLGGDGFQTGRYPEISGTVGEDRETRTGREGGTDNSLDQKEFSADQLGNLTLSTYAWEWADYINEFRRKLYEVWRTPLAYFGLGLIHGHTVIRLTIDRNGNMVNSRVLEHQGHSSLQVSSENAVNGVFPLKPLPVDFPDETLTLTLTLFYPQLIRRRR